MSVTICYGAIPHLEIGIDDNSGARFGSRLQREKLFEESLAFTTSSVLVSCGKDTGSEFIYTGRKSLVYWYSRLIGQPELKRIFLRQESNTPASAVVIFEVFKTIERLYSDEDHIVSIQPAAEKQLISDMLSDGDRKLIASDSPEIKEFVRHFIRPN